MAGASMENMPNLPPVMLVALTKRRTSRACSESADGVEMSWTPSTTGDLAREGFKVFSSVVDQEIDGGRKCARMVGRAFCPTTASPLHRLYCGRSSRYP
jgi:hypothetical protein